MIHRFLSYFLAPWVLFIRAMQNDFVCHLFVSLLQSIVENEKVLSSLKTTARIYSCFSSLFNTNRHRNHHLLFFFIVFIVHECIIIKIIIISSLHHQISIKILKPSFIINYHINYHGRHYYYCHHLNYKHYLIIIIQKPWSKYNLFHIEIFSLKHSNNNK